METKGKIAGCVILYNPNNDVYENILSYVKSLDMLYIVDNKNGENIYTKLKENFTNIKYIKYNENMGIAKPLNDVLKCVHKNYDYLLTMDQDSKFFSNVANDYVNEAKKLDWKNILGISPFIYGEEKDNYQLAKTQMVITSGNIINVEHAIKIGGFDENLFIDEVDHDFCYRGNLNGYFTYAFNGKYKLLHAIGKPIKKKILFHRFCSMNHNYIRTYYIMRNRLFIMFKDFKEIKKGGSKSLFMKYYLIDTIKWVFIKLLIEDDKKRKLKSILHAIYDACNHKMGKKNFNF